MSVQTVEVCVHVEMQLQLIYDLNTANTRFTIISYFQQKLILQLIKFFDIISRMHAF